MSTSAVMPLLVILLKCSHASQEAFVLSVLGRLGASKKERGRDSFMEEQLCKGEGCIEQALGADGTVCTRWTPMHSPGPFGREFSEK